MITKERVKLKKGIYSHYPDIADGQTLLLSDKEKQNSFLFIKASDLYSFVDEIKDIADNEPTLRCIIIERDDLAMEILFVLDLSRKFSVPLRVVVDTTAVDRVVAAWSIGAENDIVASARLFKNVLYVFDGAFQSYAVPIDRLIAEDKNCSEKFEIHEFGHYIWWPDLDLHVTIDDVRSLVVPGYKEQKLLEESKYYEKYGAAIKKLRERSKLSKVSIEEQTGLSARQLQRYENEGRGLTHKALERLANAHNMQLDKYLNELAKIATEFQSKAH